MPHPGRHIIPTKRTRQQKGLKDLGDSLLQQPGDYADMLELQVDLLNWLMKFRLDLAKAQYKGNLQDLGYFIENSVIGVNNGKTKILRQLNQGDWYFFEASYGDQRWMQVQVRLNTLNKREFTDGTKQGVWAVFKGVCPFSGVPGGIVCCLKRNQGVLKGRGPTHSWLKK